ncbi:MAG: hypothetical protein Q9217_006971, partial [Psora testacea]
TGSSNNYAYLVKDDKSNDAVIIDPANPPEYVNYPNTSKQLLSRVLIYSPRVVPVLKEQIDGGKINLTAINLKVIGGKDCEAVTTTPKHEETFMIGHGISVKALYTPCHTQDSICWYMEDGNEKVVFTGDTLFIGGTLELDLSGCGRFFEGTPAEMHKALNETLAALPNDTKVYPGHEYTKQNVKFLVTVLPTDPVKKLQSFTENNHQTQGKFTIGDEKDPTIQKATGKTDPVDVMKALREMKNSM